MSEFSIKTPFGSMTGTQNYLVLSSRRPKSVSRVGWSDVDVKKACYAGARLWRKRIAASPFVLTPASQAGWYVRFRRWWFPYHQVRQASLAVGADRFAIVDTATGQLLLLVGPRGRGAVMSMTPRFVRGVGGSAVMRAAKTELTFRDMVR